MSGLPFLTGMRPSGTSLPPLSPSPAIHSLVPRRLWSRTLQLCETGRPFREIASDGILHERSRAVNIEDPKGSTPAWKSRREVKRQRVVSDDSKRDFVGPHIE